MALLLLAVGFTLTSTSADNVTWKVSSIPPVFGSTVILECTILESANCVSTGRWKWTGGEDFRLIALKDMTSNQYKYQSVLESCTVFSLYIHNLSESDVNLPYACGFNFRKQLSLSDYPFEYRPQDGDFTKYIFINYNTLYSNITIFKVYPVPSCLVLVSNKDVSNYSRSYITEQGLMYAFRLILNYQLNVEMCKGNFSISCIIGQFQLEIVTEHFDKCVEASKASSTFDFSSLAYIITPILACLCTCIPYILCRRCRLRPDKAGNGNNMETTVL